MISRRVQLRQVVESNDVTRVPIVHDALSAKLADAVGFEAIALSGHGVSVSALGLPDSGYLTMPELVEVSRNVAHTVDTPVYTDVDTGFGNAIIARRTTEELIRNTECAGFHIEDQADPKRCGQLSGKQVITRKELQGKIQAVCDMRDDIDKTFVVIGRTDVLGVKGKNVDDAVVRGNEMLDVGADIIFVDGINSIEQVHAVGQRIDGPLLYNKSGPNRSVSPVVDEETLGDLGYSLVTYHASLTPTILAVHEYMSGLKEQGMKHVVEFEEELGELPIGDFYEFEGMKQVAELEREYLPDEKMLKYRDLDGKVA
jgi:2-methylisocitrate lyase-like PEP mutase family enzyme